MWMVCLELFKAVVAAVRVWEREIPRRVSQSYQSSGIVAKYPSFRLLDHAGRAWFDISVSIHRIVDPWCR